MNGLICPEPRVLMISSCQDFLLEGSKIRVLGPRIVIHEVVLWVALINGPRSFGGHLVNVCESVQSFVLRERAGN